MERTNGGHSEEIWLKTKESDKKGGSNRVDIGILCIVIGSRGNNREGYDLRQREKRMKYEAISNMRCKGRHSNAEE